MPCSTQRPMVLVLVAVAAVLVVGLGARAAGRDDPRVPPVPPPNLARWGEVTAWKGTFRAVKQGGGVTHNGIHESSHETIVDGTVFLDKQTQLGSPNDKGARMSIWHGRATASVRIQDHDNTWHPPKHELKKRREESGEGIAEAKCMLEISAESGEFWLHVWPLRIDTRITGSPGESIGSKEFLFDDRDAGGSGSLPESGLLLNKIPKTRTRTGSDSYKSGTNSYTCSYTLQPVGESPEIELVVEPQGYASWRPEAGPDERSVGNEIKIDAKLQGPGGGVAKVKARKIIFELTGTSREPGVALNFPLAAAATSDFDLQFSPKSNPPGQYIILGPANQRAETVPGQYASASITVSSFDWGAWSTLMVTAELEDGRRVTGHLKGERGTTQILVPKRAKDSKIADIWKQNAGISQPDNDDSEPGPAGNNNLGDGFTLYEEYRGFYVDGKHISGDPKKIDFFVRNYIGADAEPGIFLFADLTGAEVHSRLLDTEFDRQIRVMNGNHGQVPHRVDQHGVFLETQPTLDGGHTYLSKAGVRGRPVITLSVNLQPRDSLTSMVTSENVPVSDLAFAYDRGIAHELMHSVGAEHHGIGDGNAAFFFVFADDPKNKTGKSHFRFSLMDGGKAVTITDEASGRDLASLMEGEMMLHREQMRPEWYPRLLTEAKKFIADRPGYDIPWTAEQLAEHDLSYWAANTLAHMWYVGAEHGECSGNELCVMRYYFARLYEKKGTENSFYIVRDSRSEHAGLELCRLPEGTGINDKDRKPQPRYGDAAATRGACAASIIFNDVLPLKSDAIPKQQGSKP